MSAGGATSPARRRLPLVIYVLAAGTTAEQVEAATARPSMQLSEQSVSIKHGSDA